MYEALALSRIGNSVCHELQTSVANIIAKSASRNGTSHVLKGRKIQSTGNVNNEGGFNVGVKIMSHPVGAYIIVVNEQSQLKVIVMYYFRTMTLTNLLGHRPWVPQ